ncbi:hypothetical protein CD351_04985 [Erythrobacter sp. KY5]|uniref:FixH family protein n=1 Tax=Erythrobacter sp. KY5 TaxID=2011159 RepID=UPI000DBF062D|nr:FixH family protein [Erythrobacter sp. KY5]AWW73777.1 hypothetical protein CD351_04985 [Erythrobacter sp. KY5]
MASKPHKPFTGKHMAAILVAGFGVVMCVNFYMASRAVSGFHGTVVENSYIASQNFNDWLDKADASKALGWQAHITRDEAEYVTVTASGVPVSAMLTAELRRPIGEREYASLTFEPMGEGRYRSSEPVAQGRWTMRLFIEADGKSWAEESELPR